MWAVIQGETPSRGRRKRKRTGVTKEIAKLSSSSDWHSQSYVWFLFLLLVLLFLVSIRRGRCRGPVIFAQDRSVRCHDDIIFEFLLVFSSTSIPFQISIRSVSRLSVRCVGLHRAVESDAVRFGGTVRGMVSWGSESGCRNLKWVGGRGIELCKDHAGTHEGCESEGSRCVEVDQVLVRFLKTNENLSVANNLQQSWEWSTHEWRARCSERDSRRWRTSWKPLRRRVVSPLSIFQLYESSWGLDTRPYRTLRRRIWEEASSYEWNRDISEHLKAHQARRIGLTRDQQRVGRWSLCFLSCTLELRGSRLDSQVPCKLNTEWQWAKLSRPRWRNIFEAHLCIE